jgi:cytochrome c oxidase cbb3-type subunit IV
MADMYALLAGIAQKLGVVFFFTAFLIVCAYALWPSNRARFDAAARLPLSRDNQP